MPELDLLDSTGALHLYAFPRLFSVMLFPTDDKLREQFREFARRQAPLEPSTSMAQPPPLYQVLDHARNRYLTQGKPVERGGIAGEILVTIRQIHEHHLQVRPDEPSIAKTIVIVAARRKTGTSILESAWSKFRSVAHLWAALVCVQLQASGSGFPREFDPSYLDSLPAFLALAEDMRRFGEGVTTRSFTDSKPILPPEKTWRVPEGFPLPDVGVSVPPMSNSDVRELKGYQARHRH